MKLEKINRLFAAYTSNTQPTQKTAQEKQIQDVTSNVQEAVKVAKDFGNATVAAQEHRAKVDRIKSEVQNGTYKSDSKDVAKALIRDLFA